jgi:tRNA U34 2-thiouridine synthase MnmA/TrmU
MAVRCVALLSGGLDSMLAIRLVQEQGVEVEALNFKTIFTCCQDQSGHAARDLGVRLTVVGQDDDYLDLVKSPRFGYGKGANPCVDCRIYMFQKARRFMEQVGAQFIISGEVVGQRPMSQKRGDLDVISRHSDLDDLLLRPLSAKLLLPTKPEREGLVDREQLFGFHGRSRKGLIALAKKFGFKDIPSPSTGCALTETRFSQKVHDLIQIEPQAKRWDFELLKTARHFRFDAQTKVVVGRDESDNESLRYMHRLPDAASTALLEPENFPGPVVLLIGPETPEAMSYAVGMVTRYSKSADFPAARILVQTRSNSYAASPQPHPAAEQARTLATV